MKTIENNVPCRLQHHADRPLALHQAFQVLVTSAFIWTISTQTFGPENVLTLSQMCQMPKQSKSIRYNRPMPNIWQIVLGAKSVATEICCTRDMTRYTAVDKHNVLHNDPIPNIVISLCTQLLFSLKKSKNSKNVYFILSAQTINEPVFKITSDADTIKLT